MDRFKKTVNRIAAFAGGALMVGATIAGALAAVDMATLPQPFVTSAGQFDSYIVVGTMGWNPNIAFNAQAAEDLAGDVAVGMDLSAAFAQTATSASAGASELTTVSEGVLVRVPGDDLNYGETIFNVKSSYGDNDLDFLSDETFSESRGNTKNAGEDYSQTIDFLTGTAETVFERDTTDSNRVVDTYFKMSKGTALYDYEVVFSGGIDYDTTAVNDDFKGAKMNLQGTTYTISAASGVASAGTFKMELLSGSMVISQGEYTTQTYTFGGETYEISVPVIADGDGSVKLIVNGDTTDKLYEGDTTEIAGIEVGVDEVFINEGSEAMGADMVTFYLGANKLTLQSGSEVKVNDAKIDDWKVESTWTGTAGAGTLDTIDTLTVTATPKSDIFMRAGDELVDPFMGNWKIVFAGIDKITEDIEMTTSGDQGALRFTNLNGAEVEIPVINDGTNVWLGEELKAATTEIKQDGDSSAEGMFLIANNDYCEDTLSFGNCDFVQMLVVGTGGEARVIEISGISDPNGTWATGDEVADLEDLTTGKTWNEVKLNGNDIKLGFATIKLDASTSATGDRITATQINQFVGRGNLATADLKLSGSGEMDITADGTNVLVDITESNGNLLYTANSIGFVDDTNGDVDINNDIGGNLNWLQSERNSDYKEAIDALNWGALFRYDSKNSDVLEISLPEEEAISKVYIAPTGAAATAVTSGTVSLHYISGTAGIAKTDADFRTTVPNRNVILVGGPSVNKLVYDLAVEGKTQTAAEYVEDTAVIQMVENAYGQRDALVVAGYAAKDTAMAGRVVSTYVLGQGFAGRLSGDLVTLNTAGAATVTQVSFV